MPKPQRQRGALPAHWKFRDGRPRWEPSPTRRAEGWKGADLKDPRTGAWLSEGASIDTARAINFAVEAWRTGAAVPAEFARFAPVGTAVGAPVADRGSIGELIRSYQASDEFIGNPQRQIKGLANSTRRDYKGKLKRLVDVLAGWTEPPGPDAHPRAVAAYQAAVAAIKASPIETLYPPPRGDRTQALLLTAYRNLRRDVGAHMASGVLATASAWLEWCLDIENAVIMNPAKLVKRETPPGRIRPATWPEIQIMVKTADAMGLPSIGDAVVLGVDLSWSQVDRLALTWDRAKDGRAVTGLQGRQKTGRVGGTPFLKLGLGRLAKIRLRQQAMDAQPTHVLWCERTGAPWKEDHYRHVYAEVRAVAAETLPSVATLRDQDLRDTAFTIIREAGAGDDGTASRTLQSRRHIAQLADAHYGEIGPVIADATRDLVNAYMKKKGMVL